MQYEDAGPEHESEPEYEGLDHKSYVDMWREAVDGYGDARQQNIRDEEYYDGDIKGTGWGHWTETQLATLGLRGQPPVTRNIVCRKVNSICGIEQRSRSEPRALPRTPKDQKSAEIATDALRYVKERTRWSSVKAEKFLEAVKIGYAAVEIGGAEDHVPITPIAWKDFLFDPRSRNFDFSDARYLGVAKWMDADQAKVNYAGPEIQPPQIPPQPPPGTDPFILQQWAQMAQEAIAAWQREVKRRQAIIDTIDNTLAGAGSDRLGADRDEFEDRPSRVFFDEKRKRVFVVDMWHQDPKRGWFRCVFTGAGKLFTQEASYIEKDDWGRKRRTHPIKAFSIHVSKDLWRSGEVRGMRSTQDEVNFRLSKKLHYLATNQLFYEPGAFQEQDVSSVRREIDKPNGAIAVNKIDGYRIEKNLDAAMALDVAMQEAMRFIDLEGANPELQGRGPAGQSGRAILARQQAGLGQLGPLFDRFYDWELQCYRAIWARVQQFWTAPMYVRVTDDKNAARFAAVNGAPVVDIDNGNQAQMIGANGGPPMTPEDMGEFGPMLAELDMDIIIDRAPEAATLQAEQYEALVQLAQSGALGPPNPETARFLITASSLPNKSELLDMLDKIKAQPQGPSPQEMAMLKKLAAEIERTLAQAKQANATAAKTAAEIPGAQADAALTEAKARVESINATMNEVSADDALGVRQRLMAMPVEAPGFAFPSNASPAAADQTGASGLPPLPANGPPPF